MFGERIHEVSVRVSSDNGGAGALAGDRRHRHRRPRQALGNLVQHPLAVGPHAIDLVHE